eukprot:4193962-Pleurochrysis_carterae.AAC.3
MRDLCKHACGRARVQARARALGRARLDAATRDEARRRATRECARRLMRRVVPRRGELAGKRTKSWRERQRKTAEKGSVEGELARFECGKIKVRKGKIQRGEACGDLPAARRARPTCRPSRERGRLRETDAAPMHD